MQINTINSVYSADLNETFASGLEQRSSVTCAIFFLSVLVPALIVVLLPVFSLISLALSDAGIRAQLVDKINSVLLAGLGLGVWAILWGIPAWHFIKQLCCKRFIKITNFEVQVRDKSLLSTHTWSCRLNEFVGLSHKVRTTLSGARHELVLVHPQREKCVLVYMAPAISHAQTRQFARVLKQEVLSTPGLSEPVQCACASVEHEGVRNLEPLAA